MPERVVVFRVGGNLCSLPFASVDEITNTHRIMDSADLPDDAGLRKDAASSWVATRGRFVPLAGLFPQKELSPKAQILVLRDNHGGVALAADQVLGIESVGESLPFPASAAACCRIPYAGVRVWKGRVVLELDLPRLISLHW